MKTFGVVTKNGHVDVSKTLHGAKIIATKAGFTEISVRTNGGYHTPKVAIKRNGKWQPYDSYSEKHLNQKEQ